MEYYITRSTDYWIAPTAVRIMLNALGNKNRIQGTVTSGAVIMCFIDSIRAENQGGEAGNGDGLWYDANGQPKQWPITIAPTYFNSDTRKYVYAAIPRRAATGSQAIIVFPSEKLDVYGRVERTSASSSSSDEPTITYEQVGSTEYFYIYLQGIISAPYGTPEQRWWEQEITDWGRLDTPQGDEEKKYEMEWYQFSPVTQVVTFLKEIAMQVGSSFRNLILNGKNLTDVATGTLTEPVDSDTMVTTPNYVSKFALSKTEDDTANGMITFMKGLISQAQAVFNQGVSIAENLTVGGQAIIDNIKSRNYTGDGMADTGFRLTNDDGTGSSAMTVDNLYVRKKATFEELEVKKETAVAGNEIRSAAANVINRTDYIGLDDDNNEVVLGYSYVKVPWLMNRMPFLLNALNYSNRFFFGRKRLVRTYLDASQRANVTKIRCYFLANDGDREVNNLWQANDLALSFAFNLKSSRRNTYMDGSDTKLGNVRWWRKVEAVSSNTVTLDDGKEYHYFDVKYNYAAEQAATTNLEWCERGSDIPAAGDHVVQFGNTTVANRQNIISSEIINDDSPAIKLYHGINSFSTEGKRIIAMGYGDINNTNVNNAFLQVFGDAYIGTPANAQNQSYLKYIASQGLLQIKARIEASSTIGSQSISDYIHSNTWTQAQIEALFTDDFANIAAAISEIQDQIDGAIETWFYNGAPSASVLPESEWVAADVQSGTNNERLKHLGDLYYDNETGRAYRYSNSGTEASPVFAWNEISDSAVIKALANAAKAQDTADHKRRVFVSQPAPVSPLTYVEYDVGDLWANATYTDTNVAYSNDLLRCKVAKPTRNEQGEITNGNFEISDWELASKYTDNSVVDEIISKYGNILGIQNPTAENVGNALGILQKALSGQTIADGGLVLTTMIALKNGNNVMSGINGGLNDQLDNPLRTPAAWFGGPMVDHEADTSAANYAKSLFRFDGTGYLAGGNITWDANGGGSVAGGKIAWNAAGNITKVEGDTVKATNIYLNGENITSALNAILTMFEIDTNGDIKTKDYVENGVTKHRGFYSESFISALGQGSGGSGGGGSTDMNIVWSALNNATTDTDEQQIDVSHLHRALTGYATQSWVTGTALSGYATQSWVTGTALAGYALSSDIPTNNNQLTNGAGYITSAALNGYALSSDIPTNNNQLTNGAGYITASALTGYATESYVGTQLAGYLPLTGGTLNGSLVVNPNSGGAKIECDTEAGVKRAWMALDPNLPIGAGSDYLFISRYEDGRGVIESQNGTLSLQGGGVFINNSHHVGIGTTSPAYTLDVAGDIRATSNILTGTGDGQYVQIGGIRLVYDSTNNALKVVQSDGTTAANFYATGGVSALGYTTSGGGGGSIDMNVVWSALAGNTNEQINASHLETALTGYATQTWINTQLGSYLPLTGGTMANTNVVTNLNADLLDGHHASYFQPQNAKIYDYTKVNAFPSGEDGWYSIFAISDSTYGTVICSIKAFAHSSLTFIVSKGYNRESTLQILQYNGSAGSSWFWVKGVRILSDGTVQALFNKPDYGRVVVSINIFSTSGTLSPYDTLTLETGSPDVLRSLLGSHNKMTTDIVGDADTVDGIHATIGSYTPFGTIPAINASGFMDVGNAFDMHYDNTTASDFSTRLYCTGDHRNSVALPSISGTLALTSQIPTNNNQLTNGAGYITLAALNGYATENWVSTNYVSIAFFNRLFTALNGSTTVAPNDVNTTIDNIKAMVGLWTEQYISALGQGSGGGGGGGTDMNIVWSALAGNTNEQINASHLETALTGYALSSQIPTNNNQLTNGAGYITSSGSCASATTAGSCTGNAATATALANSRSLWGNSFNGGSDINGGLTFGDLSANQSRDLLYQKMADKDYFRLRVGGASNSGWVELATADDGNEPIYVRQYTGVFATVTRTATLLDGSGNTSFPGTVSATFSGNLTGNVTGNVTGNCSGSSGSCTGNAATSSSCSGNAATATKLAASKTIWGQSFDGSGNISGAMSSVGDMTMNDSARIISGGTALFIGNTNNSGWLRLMDVCSQADTAGDDNWSIRTNGKAHFKSIEFTAADTPAAHTGGFRIGKFDETGGLKMQFGSSAGNIRILNTSWTNALFEFTHSGNFTATNSVITQTVHATVGIYSDGYVSALGQNTSSDERLKDIADYDALPAIEDIAKAPAIHYQWKHRKGMGMQVGSIAQYWQQLMPEAVHKDGEGYLSMQYDVLALTSAISIARKVMTHEERIAALERENETLRNEINKLKTA